MKRQFCLLICVSFLFLGSALMHGDIYGVFIEGETQKSLASINPSTGAITKIGTSHSIGAFSTGVAAVNSAGTTVYFAANLPGETERRLFSLSLSDGALLNYPVLSMVPSVLFYRSGSVLGLFHPTSLTVQLYSINPSNGSMATVGSAIDAGGYMGGVGTYNGPADSIHFAAIEASGTRWRLYTVHPGTGNMTGNPVIAPPVNYDETPYCLAASSSGTLLGILPHSTNGSSILVSFNTTSGAATTIGSGFTMGGYSPGVCTYDSSTGRLLMAAADPAGEEIPRHLYSIQVSTGAIATSPFINTPYLVNAPVFLAYAGGSSGGSPGRIPDGYEVSGQHLTVEKNTTNSDHLDLAWGASCFTSASDYAVYTGTPGDFSSHDQTLCSTSSALSTTLTTTPADAYFLVVPTTSTHEGGYGSDSTGSPRPRSGNPCITDTDTTPCP